MFLVSYLFCFLLFIIAHLSSFLLQISPHSLNCVLHFLNFRAITLWQVASPSHLHKMVLDFHFFSPFISHSLICPDEDSPKISLSTLLVNNIKIKQESSSHIMAKCKFNVQKVPLQRLSMRNLSFGKRYAM